MGLKAKHAECSDPRASRSETEKAGKWLVESLCSRDPFSTILGGGVDERTQERHDGEEDEAGGETEQGEGDMAFGWLQTSLNIPNMKGESIGTNKKSKKKACAETLRKR